MDTWISLNSTSNGKEKFIRLMQFSSRLLYHSLHFEASDQGSALKKFEEALSLSRRVIWLGRFVDTFASTQQTLSLEDPVLKFTLTMSRISGSLLVFVDNLNLLASLGFVRIDQNKWNSRSSRLWLYCIVMGLVRDWHELQGLLARRKSESNCHLDARSSRIGDEDKQYIVRKLSSFLVREKALSIDTLRNLCDLWIPLTSLGYVKLSPRTISLFGTVSSICGVIQAVDASTRLSPS